MNACPACSQTVGPNDVVCPKCGISLHHGTATAGPAAGGKGTSVVLIVGLGLIALFLVLGCLVFIGGALFMVRTVARPAATAMPVGSTIDFEVEEMEVLPDVEVPPGTPSKTESAIP